MPPEIDKTAMKKESRPPTRQPRRHWMDPKKMLLLMLEPYRVAEPTLYKGHKDKGHKDKGHKDKGHKEHKDKGHKRRCCSLQLR
ncbi:putative uncharacterized protein DDB_G0292636 [Lineus longissimus]|uniref:putative uncharacterized protein DDB_G0292636 n=1 Tax=Lineus longissimus TaxID=88925 RepID=UPI00315C8DFA